MTQSSSNYLVHHVSLVPVAKKLQDFLRLPSGWHHGEGTPPNPGTVRKALSLNEVAENEFLLTDAVPGLSGEIQLVVYGHETNRDKYLEITVEPDETMNITRYELISDRWHVVADEDVSSVDDVKLAIEQFAGEIFRCHTTSEYYQGYTIWNTSGGLPVQPLRSTKAEYRLY